MKTLATVIVATSLMTAPALTLADVPAGINFQGRLTNAGGVPVADGDYSVRFRVYDNSLLGSTLWDNTQIVTVSDGSFLTQLAVPDSVFNHPNRWLGMQVEADPELSPLTPLTSTPYAHRSGQWTSVGRNIHRGVGKVGLGTATPLSPLHVRDTATAGFEYIARFEGASPGGTAIELRNAQGNHVWEMGVNSDGGLFPGHLYFASVQAFPPALALSISKSNVVTVAESLAVGAVNPQERLHVDGKIKANGMMLGDNTVFGSEGKIRLESRNSSGSAEYREWEISVPQTGSVISGKGYDLAIDDMNIGTDPEAVFQWGSGYLGLGVLDPVFRIDLPNVANVSGQGRANAWTTYSSRRWKDNVRTISDALTKIEKLRGVEYDNKSDGSHSIGLIAEEVGEVVPEVVQFEANGTDAASLDYARLVALLIEGMKEQQRQIDDLKASLQAVQP